MGYYKPKIFHIGLLGSYLNILSFLWQSISITSFEAFVYMMLDAPFTAGFTLRFNWLCWILVSGCWIFFTEYRFPVKKTSIEYRVSRIEHLALYGSNVNANDIFISGYGLSELGLKLKKLL